MTYHHRRGSELLSATRRVGNYLEPFDGRPLGLVRLYGLRLLHKELGHSLAQRTTVSPKRPAPRGPLKFEASFHACLPHNCPARITPSPACPSHKSPSNIVRLKRDFDTDVFESMLIEHTDGRTARRLFPKLFFPPNVWLLIIISRLLSLSVWAPKFFLFFFVFLSAGKRKSIVPVAKIYSLATIPLQSLKIDINISIFSNSSTNVSRNEHKLNKFD